MKLHSYQERAVAHLHRYPRSALFLEMGLGKTAVALCALAPDNFPVLVVAPKRVAEHVWLQEAVKWRPDLEVVLAAGSPVARKAALASGAEVIVIGRDNLKDVPLGHFRTIILDELSSFKSQSSIRFKLARKFTKEAKYVWGLTGTPASNGYLDLWSEVFLLDRGERLGTGITKYRHRYFIADYILKSGVVTSWRPRPGTRGRVNRLLKDICLSMSVEDYLELPPVMYNQVNVDIPMRAYRDMKRTLVADLTDVIGPAAIHTAANAAVASSKLMQITSGFLYSDTPGYPVSRIHNAKTDAAREIVDGTGSPVLIFYHFTEERDALRDAFPLAFDIDDAGAIERWNEGKIPVLLAHPAAAGHGLNLQYGGHTIIFVTLPWSLEEYEQAVGRIARQGQTKSVVVHHIVAPGTVDEEVLKALRGKASVQNALMEYLSEERALRSS